MDVPLLLHASIRLFFGGAFLHCLCLVLLGGGGVCVVCFVALVVSCLVF